MSKLTIRAVLMDKQVYHQFTVYRTVYVTAFTLFITVNTLNMSFKCFMLGPYQYPYPHNNDKCSATPTLDVCHISQR